MKPRHVCAVTVLRTQRAVSALSTLEASEDGAEDGEGGVGWWSFWGDAKQRQGKLARERERQACVLVCAFLLGM